MTSWCHSHNLLRFYGFYAVSFKELISFCLEILPFKLTLQRLFKFFVFWLYLRFLIIQLLYLILQRIQYFFLYFHFIINFIKIYTFFIAICLVLKSLDPLKKSTFIILHENIEIWKCKVWFNWFLLILL